MAPQAGARRARRALAAADRDLHSTSRQAGTIIDLPRTAALGDMFRGDSVRISENLAFDQAIVRSQASTHTAPLRSWVEMMLAEFVTAGTVWRDDGGGGDHHLIHDHVNVVHDRGGGDDAPWSCHVMT